MSRSRIIAGKAVIVIEAVDHVNQTLNKIRTNLHRSANALNQAGGAMARTGFFGSIASGLMLRQFAKFDDAMLALRVKLGFVNKLTSEQTRIMNGLETTIRNLGKTTSFTSQEIANAAVTLAQGGLNPTEIKNSLRAVLDLARGTQAALDDAGRMFIRTMRTFNIESSQADLVVSQFVRATRFGTLNIEDLEQALRYSAGTAATLDQNLSPMLAIFAELSNKGLAGSIGGTSMNTAMANMIKKLEDIQGLIPGFQLVRNQNGLDMLATFKELFNFTKNLPSTEQVKIFQDLFNLRGSRAVAGIRDIDNVIRMADEIANAGNEARKAAEIMDSGMGGRGRIALSALQDAILALGKASEKYVIPALNTIKNLINELNTLIQRNPDIAAAIVASPFALLASGMALIALGKALRVVATSFGLVTTAARPAINLLGAGLAGQVAALTTGIAGRPGGKRTGRTGGLFQMLFGTQQISKRGRAQGRRGGLAQNLMRGFTGIGNVGTTAANAGRGLLFAANAARRFVFSFTGLFTILELLLLTTSVGDRLGKGLSNAFKAIAASVNLARGPWSLFTAGLEAIAEGKTRKGLIAIKDSFMALVAIIGSQLVAAWNRFKEALGPVFDTVRAVVVSLLATLDIMFTSLKEGLQATFSTLGQAGDMIGGNFFGGDGSIARTAANIGQWIAQTIPTLIAAIGKFIVDFNASIQKFLAELEFILADANPANIGLGKIYEGIRQNRIDEADVTARNRKRRIDDQLAIQLAKINEAFKGGAAEQGAAGASAARGRSQQIASWTYAAAAQLRESIRAGTKQAMEQVAQGPPTKQGGIPNMMNNLEQAKQVTRIAAAALVGSAAATRGNLLRVNDSLEKQQLEALQDIRDDQRKGLRDRGVILQ